MSSSNLLVEISNHIATIQLNRPKLRNALDHATFLEIGKTFQEMDNNPEVRAIVLSGAGKSFCAGLDLSSMAGIPSLDMGEQTPRNRMEFVRDVKVWQDALTAVENCRKPVIAAIHGACIGGGLDIASACDIRLASEDAFFSLREVAMAICADLGVLQRLPLIVGQGFTREMAFTAADYTAQQVLEMKLLNRILPDQETLFQSAQELAQQIAAQSPLAVQSSKDVLNRGRDMSFENSLHYAAMKNSVILPSGELIEAFQAFMEKRKPNF